MDVVACSQSGFVFRRLSEAEIAFRDRMIRFFRIAMMHGRINHHASEIEVVGLADWSFVFVSLLFFSMSIVFLSGGAVVIALLAMAVLIGMVALSYKITRERLDGLVTEINAQVEHPLPD